MVFEDQYSGNSFPSAPFTVTGLEMEKECESSGTSVDEY